MQILSAQFLTLWVIINNFCSSRVKLEICLVIKICFGIAGLKDLKSVSHHTSLAELGLDSMMSVEIKQTLEREFEVFLTAQDIRGLNFAKLIEMSAKDEEEKTKESAKPKLEEGGGLLGMQMLYRVVGDQDIVPDVCLKMKTMDEPGRAEVFLIPGIEGLASIFKDIAPKLKSPACCLQIGVSSIQTTIDDIMKQLLPVCNVSLIQTMFDVYMHLKNSTRKINSLFVLIWCLQHVKERSKTQKSFIIVGYSFGSMVAIELGRQLECMGKQGRLILIDGSPQLMKLIVSQHLAAQTNEELQNNVLLGICDVAMPTISGLVRFFLPIEYY